AGVKCDPLFEPSLADLLKLRLPHWMVERQQYVFTEAARRNPHAAKKIVEYLSTHRVFDAASRIAETIPLDGSQRESLERELASSMAPFRAPSCLATDQNRRRESKQTMGVV